MSRNFETQDCQRYEVKRIKSIFADKGNKIWGTSIFNISVVLISSITPIEQYFFKINICNEPTDIKVE